MRWFLRRYQTAFKCVFLVHCCIYKKRTESSVISFFLYSIIDTFIEVNGDKVSGYTLCLAEVRAWLTRGGPKAAGMISKRHPIKVALVFTASTYA